MFGKAWKSAHICFWVCQLQCTMLELCVTSWIGHASNTKYAPLEPFWLFELWWFIWTQSMTMHYVRTLCDKYFLSYDGLSELSMTKNEKKTLICTGIKCWKAWILVHIGFWVCWLQWSMLELCVTSTFWVMMGFSWFLTGRSWYRGLKPGVGVEWDPRRTAE